MKKFKHGDHIIYDNVEFYVSYSDKDEDHIFLTNNENLSYDQIINFNTKKFFSQKEIDLIKEEAEKLGYKYYLHPFHYHSIYAQFKFATKQKLKNILNR